MIDSKFSQRLSLLAALVVGGLLGAGGLALYGGERFSGSAHAGNESEQASPPSSSPGPQGVQPANPFFGPDHSWWDVDFFGSDSDREWNPFEEIRRMETEMNRLFDSAWDRASRISPGGPTFSRADSPFNPDLELRDEGDHFVVEMDLPGADKSDVRIDVEGQILIIAGTRQSATQERDKQGTIIRNERRTGSFSRTIPLPAPVDADRVEATQEAGVLRITLPKAATPSETHPIEIK